MLDAASIDSFDVSFTGMSATEVYVTGQISDENPATVQIDFTGALAGTVYADESGYFQFYGDATALGTVTAVATDDESLSSPAAELELTSDAPSIDSLSIVENGFGNDVTISGTVTDEWPDGLAIVITGVVDGSLIADSSGYFSGTFTASGLGTITATTIDVWGQTSNAPTADLASTSPSIAFSVTPTGEGRMVTISGSVNDESPQGLTVNLSGVVSGSIVTDSMGNFSDTIEADSLGTVTAVVADPWGLTSDSVDEEITSNSPSLDLNVSVTEEGDIEVSGNVNDDEWISDLSVVLSGVINATIQSDSMGYFSQVFTGVSYGVVQGTVADVWGILSNLAQADVPARGKITFVESVPDVDEGDLDANGDPVNTSLTFKLKLTGAIPGGFDLKFHTADSTSVDAATAGGDYVGITNGTVHFAGTDGEVQEIVIVVKGDEMVELNEEFNLILDGIQNTAHSVTIAHSSAIGLIFNDDQAVITMAVAFGGVQPADYWLEADAGQTKTYTFVPTMSKKVDKPIYFQWETSDIWGATAGEDFQSNSGSGSFGILSQQATPIQITVNGDDKVELDELFNLVFKNLQTNDRNVIFRPIAGVAPAELSENWPINNNDSATVSINQVAASSAFEGNVDLVFDVVLDQDVDTSVVVDIGTETVSALGGTDYEVTFETITFAGVKGETHQFKVRMIEDNLVELNEAFNARILVVNPDGRDVSIHSTKPSATGVIYNEDSSAISISNATIQEGNGGVVTPKIMIFNLTLTNPVDVPITLTFSTVGISALPGIDFESFPTTAPGTVIIPAGTTTWQIQIKIYGDTIDEPTETFKITLESITVPGGLGGGFVTIDDDEAIGTITDDD